MSEAEKKFRDVRKKESYLRHEARRTPLKAEYYRRRTLGLGPAPDFRKHPINVGRVTGEELAAVGYFAASANSMEARDNIIEENVLAARGLGEKKEEGKKEGEERKCGFCDDWCHTG